MRKEHSKTRISSGISNPKTQSRQFTLCALFVVTGLIAIVFAGWKSLGTSGIGPALALNCVIWFSLSRFKNASLNPINHQRMTIVELIVILVLCAVLHGQLLPAVQSGPHRRRPAVPSLGPVLESSETAGAILDGANFTGSAADGFTLKTGEFPLQ